MTYSNQLLAMTSTDQILAMTSTDQFLAMTSTDQVIAMTSTDHVLRIRYSTKPLCKPCEGLLHLMGGFIFADDAV